MYSGVAKNQLKTTKQFMQSLSEKEMVQQLLLNEACLDEAISFATSPALNYGEETNGSLLHIATEVPRELLGLEPEKKPGDIDILIIPEKKQNILFDRTIAIEVKIVRPTNMKPSKNAGKMGSTQVKGLIRDGFPFIGLLHLEVPEHSPDSKKVKMPNGFLMDMFPFESAERQNGRLEKLNLPNFVGFSATGLQSSDNGFIGATGGFDKNCIRSPHTNPYLVERIQQLYNSGAYRFSNFSTFG